MLQDWCKKQGDIIRIVNKYIPRISTIKAFPLWILIFRKNQK